MADEPQVIRGIDYRSTFPFTHIFRSFRIAVHPSKILLALAFLILLYLGGRVLDAVWPSKHLAVADEVSLYAENPAKFRAAREARQREGEEFYANMLGQYLPDRDGLKTPADRTQAARDRKYVGEVKRRIRALLDKNDDADGAAVRMGNSFRLVDLAAAKDVESAIEASVDDNSLRRGLDARLSYINTVRAADVQLRNAQKSAQADAQRTTAQETHKKVTDDAVTARNKEVDQAKAAAEDRRKNNAAEFDREKAEFISETRKGHAAAVAALYNDYDSKLEQLAAIGGRGLFITFFNYQVRQVDGVVAGVIGGNFLGRGGVVDCIWNFFTVGPAWLVTQHWVYFTLFAVWFLVLWAVFGGAITRIAAVHVARDEKLSVRQALRFSTSKFVSFVSAPLIPLIVLAVIGVVVALGGLVGSIPVVGPLFVGVLFFLALLAGLLMALVLIGTVGGFGLMYPTIAVEGSDSFDAISRSFSYLYARPWRLGFYTLLAIVYGALTYLFVRFFVYLLLSLTHYFVDLGMLSTAYNAQSAWNTMWPAPASQWKLSYDVNFSALGFFQQIGAFLIAFWVYLTVGLVGAYAISYYFSVHTVIYYLMRKEVDATELDDVHLDPSEEDLAAEPVATAPGVTVSVEPAPSAPATPASGDSTGNPVPPPANG
jgi:hypothetical protein